jgi:tRNA-uridine 2-sulfurtransferase
MTISKSSHAAIALFSGGLDSILAVKWMQARGYKVYPVYFLTPYMPAERALQSAMENGIQLIVRDISREHLAMMQNPVYGFGKHLNPCVDCHALMFKIAGELMAELGADYLISGEVLGQRPMSQRRDAMNLVGKLSGYKDLLIRPLSQKLLNDTLPIREGWIDKADLLDIHGRGRSRQIELAEELGIVSYPAPAGGCLLTDRNFTLRLRDLIKHDEVNDENLELIRFGRHFRLDETCKLIVGRDETDNDRLEAVCKTGLKLLAKDVFGPLGILTCAQPAEEILHLALGIFWYYHKKGENTGSVILHGPDGETEHRAAKLELSAIKEYHISYD